MTTSGQAVQRLVAVGDAVDRDPACLLPLVVEAIKAELAQLADEPDKAVGGSLRPLDEIVSARAMRREQSDALGELTADEVFD